MNDATLLPTLPEDLNALLDPQQWIADPHADNTVAAIVGDWHAGGWLAGAGLAASAAEATGAPGMKDRWARIDAVNAALPSWDSNRAVVEWQADAAQRTIGIGDPLQGYLSVARSWPEWGNRERVARAETLFMDYGALSVTMLFCASLPECYVVPDLAAVLHATGQLELRVEHRIRATGAMVFPVMMRGGLTAPDGAGIAQILKVRLIHAMVRNLILRGCPEQVVAVFQADAVADGIIPALARIQPQDSMQRSLFVHGWHLKECALPNNQEELAYTLLTFSYVFLRSMRKLGIAFTPEQETDYLHAWNVAGYFLGMREELMAHTMDDAARLFDAMQARGRADHARRPDAPDPRPLLGRALMAAMQSVIPPGPLHAFPVLLTRRLIGPQSTADLGLNERVGLAARVLFVMLMTLVRGIDAVGRVIDPDFSIARLITRVVGYRLLCTLLMDQTRELVVPAALRPAIRSLVAKWGRDDHAPRWVNGLEDRLTTAGDWQPLQRR